MPFHLDAMRDLLRKWWEMARDEWLIALVKLFSPFLGEEIRSRFHHILRMSREFLYALRTSSVLPFFSTLVCI